MFSLALQGENCLYPLSFLVFSISAQTPGQPPSKIKERVEHAVVVAQVGCDAAGAGAAAAAPISQPSSMKTFRILYYPSFRLPLLLSTAAARGARSRLDHSSVPSSFSTSRNPECYRYRRQRVRSVVADSAFSLATLFSRQPPRSSGGGFFTMPTATRTRRRGRRARGGREQAVHSRFPVPTQPHEIAVERDSRRRRCCYKPISIRCACSSSSTSSLSIPSFIESSSALLIGPSLDFRRGGRAARGCVRGGGSSVDEGGSVVSG